MSIPVLAITNEVLKHNEHSVYFISIVIPCFMMSNKMFLNIVDGRILSSEMNE